MLLNKLFEIIKICKEKNITKVKKLLNENNFGNIYSYEISIINYSINSLENKKSLLLKNCKDILEKRPNSSLSYINIGNYYKNCRNYKTACKFFLSSLNKNNSIESLYLQKKLILNLLKNIKKKIKDKNFSTNKEALNKNLLKIAVMIGLKQLVTFSRPHFAIFYNASEIFLNQLELYLTKEKLVLDITEISKLEKLFKINEEIFEFSPDYDNPYFNLGFCYDKLNKYKIALKFFKKANLLENNNRYDQNLLELYYKTSDKKNFIKLSKKFKKNRNYNFTAFAICNFASKQFEIKNYYDFCKDPIKKIFKKNLIDSKEVQEKFLKNLEFDIKQNLNSTATPVVAGLKSLGNLIYLNTKAIKRFKKLLFVNLKKYKKTLDSDTIIFKKWPKKFDINAWYIRLNSGGEVSSHIHHGWVSGVFYLKKQGIDLKGDLEITEKYKDLTGNKNFFRSSRIQTRPGDLLLFPSSLPHRVVPFRQKGERISIAFDMLPR